MRNEKSQKDEAVVYILKAPCWDVSWPARGLSISRSTTIDLLSWRAALERWCAATHTQHAMCQAHLTAAS